MFPTGQSSNTSNPNFSNSNSNSHDSGKPATPPPPYEPFDSTQSLVFSDDNLSSQQFRNHNRQSLQQQQSQRKPQTNSISNNTSASFYGNSNNGTSFTHSISSSYYNYSEPFTSRFRAFPTLNGPSPPPASTNYYAQPPVNQPNTFYSQQNQYQPQYGMNQNGYQPYYQQASTLLSSQPQPQQQYNPYLPPSGPSSSSQTPPYSLPPHSHPQQQQYQQGYPAPTMVPYQSYYGQQPQNQQQTSIPFNSPCNGKKKALLIGINYFGQRGKLSGCINDVQNVKRFLIERWGFREGSDSMVVLTDDQRNPNFIPTRQNITNALKWLTGGVRYGDSLFFHFSGHGGQKRDRDGDEDDGYDETILPVDFKKAGQITDDEMHHLLVRSLPLGVRLTALFDSCHSGTALDLPYQYLPDGRLKEKTVASETGAALQEIAGSLMRGGTYGALNAGFSLVRSLSSIGNMDNAKKITRQTRTAVADVISLSGCKDRQTSADTYIRGVGSTGAMSYALIKALNMNPRPTYGQLLGSIRDILRREYSQVPQLSSGKPMNMGEYFLI